MFKKNYLLSITFKFMSIITILGLIAGCTSQTEVRNTSKPSSPIEIILVFEATPLLNEEISLSLTVKSLLDAPQLKSTVTLPPGFELISGELDVTESGIAGQNFTRTLVVKAVQLGDWQISAAATGMQSEGGIFGKTATLYVRVLETTSIVSLLPFDAKMP